MAGSLGESFARALAAKDFDKLASLLHPDVDFRGMTPGTFWQPDNAKQAIDDVIRSWFEDQDHIDELLRVDTGRVGTRERVSYLLAVTNPDGRFLVEQQAYYDTSDGLITWMRVLCSGYQAVPDADGASA
jgi:hypothetical protein